MSSRRWAFAHASPRSCARWMRASSARARCVLRRKCSPSRRAIARRVLRGGTNPARQRSHDFRKKDRRDTMNDHTLQSTSSKNTATPPARITGATRLYAIIGDPIAQVRSPETFNAGFERHQRNAVLVPVHVPSTRFDPIVRALMALGNLDGLVVTVPFKARMAPFAARLGKTASIIGAINALRREADGSWSGDMFDGLGFVRGAERKGE